MGASYLGSGHLLKMCHFCYSVCHNKHYTDEHSRVPTLMILKSRKQVLVIFFRNFSYDAYFSSGLPGNYWRDQDNMHRKFAA